MVLLHLFLFCIVGLWHAVLLSGCSGVSASSIRYRRVLSQLDRLPTRLWKCRQRVLARLAK